MDCIFCKIAQGIIPVQKIYETDDLIAIKDIAPKAEHHYLIIPKKHISNIKDCSSDDALLLGKTLIAAKTLSDMLPASPDFKLINNNGANVGQTVFHLHVHFLAGASVKPGAIAV